MAHSGVQTGERVLLYCRNTTHAHTTTHAEVQSDIERVEKGMLYSILTLLSTLLSTLLYTLLSTTTLWISPHPHSSPRAKAPGLAYLKFPSSILSTMKAAGRITLLVDKSPCLLSYLIVSSACYYLTICS